MKMRILVIGIQLLLSFANIRATNVDVCETFLTQAQEVPLGLIHYAQDLKSLGFSNKEIIDHCTHLLINESAEQVNPKIKKVVLYGAVTIGAVALISGVFYWLITSNTDVQNNVQNPTLQNVQAQNSHGTQDPMQDAQVNIVQGNIQEQHFADDAHAAIVNAANEALQGGGGVDGAIHQAAGAGQLQQYCRDNFQLDLQGNRCQAGQAVITPGFNLAPRRIIHTVAPRARVDGQWRNTLAQTYQNCMRVADQNNLTAVAFPALGTGIFGCDPQESSRIAVQTVNQYLADNPESGINEIRFVCWGQNNMQFYHDALTLIR